MRWSPAPTITCAFWVGHAPHKGHPDETKQSWWDKCRGILALLFKDAFIVGFLDANAAVGSTTCSSIMDHDADEEDFNGGLFRELLEDFQLAAPSTFPGIHEGFYHMVQQRCS